MCIAQSEEQYVHLLEVRGVYGVGIVEKTLESRTEW